MDKPFVKIKITELEEGGFTGEYLPSFTIMDVKSKGDTIEECLENFQNNIVASSKLLVLKIKEEFGQFFKNLIIKNIKIEVNYEVHLTEKTYEKIKTNKELKFYFQKIEKEYQANFFYYLTN